MEMDEGIGQIGHQGHLQKIYNVMYIYYQKQTIGCDTIEFLKKDGREGGREGREGGREGGRERGERDFCRFFLLNLTVYPLTKTGSQ